MIGAILVMAAAAGTAPAANPSSSRLAGALVDQCVASSAASAGYCFAYIAGVDDAVRAYESWLDQREFCVPATAAQVDLRNAVLGYVIAHPESREGQAASVVVVALKQAFPCPVAAAGRPPDPVPPAKPAAGMSPPKPDR